MTAARIMILMAIPCCLAFGQLDSTLTRSHLGKTLPEISIGSGSGWADPETATSLASLRGRPVLVVYTVLW